MRKTVLAGIFALSASTSFAQTSTAPAPETAAPAAPAAPAPTAPGDPAAQQAGPGGPANLCQELLAFMEAPPPEAAAPAAAAKPAATAAQPPAQQAAPAQQGAPAQQAAPAEQGSSALAGTTAAGAGASAKPETGTNSAQAVTGQEGVATDAPEPSNDKAAAGSVANAPQKDRAAPVPPSDVTSTPKDSVITVEQAEELAAANDIAVCQDMARQMRVAGVAMPPPLIALAALDLQYQENSAAGAAPAGTGPAAAGQDPASQTPAPQ